jgi:antitoxin PrlF
VVATKRPRLEVAARLTSKGQITLPKEVRDYFQLNPGDEVEFFEDEAGAIGIRRRIDPDRFKRWRGYLKHLAGQDPDEMVREMRGE